MYRALSRLLPKALRSYVHERFGRILYARRSYSQEGEDLVLLRLFEDVDKAVYVDIGAHHPYRFSNTCLFYQRGWRGINVDAKPGSMALFRRFRPHDVNLEMGISDEPAELEFFLFKEPALNTFDPVVARARQADGWELTGKCSVQCLPLAQILERELAALGTENFQILSVDVEGLDLQVLRSNDWRRFRPRVVVTEILGQDIEGLIKSDVAGFLASVGYRPFAKLHHSAVFVRID